MVVISEAPCFDSATCGDWVKADEASAKVALAAIGQMQYFGVVQMDVFRSMIS